MVSIAIANVAAKQRSATYGTYGLIVVQFAVGALLLVGLALLAEGVPSGIAAADWALIGYLALGATVMPYLIYYWSLRRVSATRASTIAYMVPLVSLSSGAILLDERIELGIVVGGIIILVEVVMTHRAGDAIVVT